MSFHQIDGKSFSFGIELLRVYSINGFVYAKVFKKYGLSSKTTASKVKTDKIKSLVVMHLHRG